MLVVNALQQYGRWMTLDTISACVDALDASPGMPARVDSQADALCPREVLLAIRINMLRETYGAPPPTPAWLRLMCRLGHAIAETYTDTAELVDELVVAGDLLTIVSRSAFAHKMRVDTYRYAVRTAMCRLAGSDSTTAARLRESVDKITSRLCEFAQEELNRDFGDSR